MENQKQGFGYFFDKSLRTLKNNLFVLVPNLVLYIIMGIISLSVMIPLINSITNNPYALVNKFSANPAAFIAGYIIFIILGAAVVLFVESGNMYMIRQITKKESKGISDFFSGLLKYPHKLLAFWLVVFLMIIGGYIALFVVILIGMQIGTFLGVILGIIMFVLFVFLLVVFQPYDAVMAVGDKGPMETISKTFKFGKANFLSLFLLSFVLFLISLLFQGAASATGGVSSLGNNMATGADFSIMPFIVVYSIQMITGVLLETFARIFKFHLYYENSGDFNNTDDESILDDYSNNEFNKEYEKTDYKLDLDKSDDRDKID